MNLHEVNLKLSVASWFVTTCCDELTAGPTFL